MTFQRCEYCGMGYEDSCGEDVRKHKRKHKKYNEVKAILGFVPRTHETRETLKRMEYEELLNKAGKSAQYSGAIDLFRAHFDRSLAAAIDGNYWKKHPNFNEYVAMVDDHTMRIVPEITMKKIREDYGRSSGEIPKGFTDWYPPRSKARKQQLQTACIVHPKLT